MTAAPEMTNTSRHGPRCPCTRCAGFSETHGSYANPSKLAPDAERWATQIRESAPLYSEADAPTVMLAAVTLARVERATAALAAVDTVTDGRELVAYLGDRGIPMQTLREDLRAWIGLASRLLAQLGCSPQSRAALGLDVVRAKAISERSESGRIDLDRLPIEKRVLLLELLDEAEVAE